MKGLYKLYVKVTELRYLKFISIFLLLCGGLLFLSTCAGDGEALRDYPVKQKSNYGNRKVSRLGELVVPCPPLVLEAWKKWDKRSDYRVYLPTEKEKGLIEADLLKLPPLIRRVLKKKLLGIFFITNIIGSGITDWVLDSRGNIYCYMIFNPIVLKKNASELITWKEQTCYRDNSGDETVEISVGGRERGFFYIALHESTHVVDYVKQITPYTEEDVKKFYTRVPESTFFTRGTWCSLKKTCRTFSFRKKIRFYGLGGPPVAERREAPKLYSALMDSPFFSLYGSINWAEDLAEFLTFYHLTQKMGLTYHISVKKGGKEVYRCEPAANPLVKKRFKTMEIFYR